MIPLYCIVDRKPIPEERVRRGAKTCDKECQRLFRRAFVLDRKERYRKAAGLPPSKKSTSGQKNSVPEAIYAAGSIATEITEHPAISDPTALGWDVAGVDPSVPIKSIWVADDVGAAAPPHLKLMEKSVAGYSEGSFSVTRPDNGWPAGQYHLEIYIGDTLAKEVPFSIKQR